MTRYAMVMDLRRCTNCKACHVACKAENDVPLGVFRTWVMESETGRYPDTNKSYLPRICNHCDDPPCVEVCPTAATFQREDGMVLQRYERCISCKYCITACPYNARYVLPRESESSGRGNEHTIGKCSYCNHRVEDGEQPACVQTCLGRTRVFGDLDDPNSEVSRLISENDVEVLKPSEGTDPQTFYIKPDRSLTDQRVVGQNLSNKEETTKEELIEEIGKYGDKAGGVY